MAGNDTEHLWSAQLGGASNQEGRSESERIRRRNAHPHEADSSEYSEMPGGLHPYWMAGADAEELRGCARRLREPDRGSKGKRRPHIRKPRQAGESSTPP